MSTIHLFTDAPVGIGQFSYAGTGSGDPGSGNWALPNATTLEVSATAQSGLDVSAEIDASSGGRVQLYAQGESRSYTVDSVAGSGAYRTLTVSDPQSSTGFGLASGTLYAASLIGGGGGAAGPHTHDLDDIDPFTGAELNAKVADETVSFDGHTHQADTLGPITGAELNTIVADETVSFDGHQHDLADITDSGTAAAQNIGTAVGDVVGVADVGGGTAGLPALDGRNITRTRTSMGFGLGAWAFIGSSSEATSQGEWSSNNAAPNLVTSIQLNEQSLYLSAGTVVRNLQVGDRLIFSCPDSTVAGGEPPSHSFKVTGPAVGTGDVTVPVTRDGGNGGAYETSIPYGVSLVRAEHQAALDGKADAEDITIENGFADNAASTISFVNGTRRFTINPALTDFTYWSNGTKYTVSSSDVAGVNYVDIGDAEGTHAIYYDGATLTVDHAPSSSDWQSLIIPQYSLVAAIYWNAADDQAELVVDERHGRVMDSATHLYLHSTQGAAFGGGLMLTEIVDDGNGDDPTHQQLGYEAGSIWDEDIQHIIGGVAAPAAVPIFYRSGADGDWRSDPNASGYVALTSGTRAYWNEDTGATWQQTEVGANADYVLTHYFATGDSSRPVIAVMGQAEYTTTAQAQAGAETEIHSLAMDQLGGLSAEFRALGTVIVQTASGYTGGANSRIRPTGDGDPYVDWREAKGVGGGAGVSPSDHAALTNLQGGTAGEYYHLSNTELTSMTTVVSEAVRDQDFTTSGDHAGFLHKTGTATYRTVRSNLSATVDPDPATDDTTLGYSIGSRWINTTSGDEFICVDATDGAAVWNATTGGGATSIDDLDAFTVSQLNTALTDTEIGGTAVGDIPQVESINSLNVLRNGTTRVSNAGTLLSNGPFHTINFTGTTATEDTGVVTIPISGLQESSNADWSGDHDFTSASTVKFSSDKRATPEVGDLWKDTHGHTFKIGGPLAFGVNVEDATVHGTAIVAGVKTGGAGTVTHAVNAAETVGFFTTYASSGLTGGWNQTGKASVAFGKAYAYSANVSVTQAGPGSFAALQAFDFPATNAGAITATISGDGAFAQGRLKQGTFTASGNGCFAQGYMAGSGAELVASGAGAFAQGRSLTGQIVAGGNGSFAQGNAEGSSDITATGLGSFAQGAATSASSYIKATTYGAMARGRASDSGQILASGAGSFASGYAYGTGAKIRATAYGSAAFGYSSSAATAIAATALNSFQFGPGTNNVGLSLQVGGSTTGVRVRGGGGTGAANGDIWRSGDYVYIRTNDTSMKLTGIQTGYVIGTSV